MMCKEEMVVSSDPLLVRFLSECWNEEIGDILMVVGSWLLVFEKL